MASRKKNSKPHSKSQSPPPTAEGVFFSQYQVMIGAVLDALLQLKGGLDSQAAVPPREYGQQPAQPVNGGTQQSPDARMAKVQELKTEARSNAPQNGNPLGQFLGEWVSHLEAIGCPPADVLKYFEQSDRTLATLYLLLAQPGNPSPTEMQRLALRYALDARQPIEGDVSLFKLRRESDCFRIAVQDPALSILAIFPYHAGE